MREQKKNEAKDAKSIRGIVHENEKIKEHTACKMVDGMVLSCTSRADVRRWNTPHDVYESAHEDVPGSRERAH